MTSTSGEQPERDVTEALLELAAANPELRPHIKRALTGEISVMELNQVLARYAGERRDETTMVRVTIELQSASQRLLVRTGVETLDELEARTGIPFAVSLAEEAGMALEVVQAVIAQEDSRLG
jgi:hypothetical protein